MTETAAQTHLAIDRVERSRGTKDRVRLRISGHASGTAPAVDGEALLVVAMHGARHRFPATPVGDDPGAATFSLDVTVPDWAVPEQAGQAVLWVGDAVVSVPPPGTKAPPHPSLAPAPAPEPPPASAAEAEAPAEPGAGRAGPLSQLLSRETIDALHAELEQRTAEAARLRGTLAQVRTDADGRASAQAELESAHAALREELSEIVGAVSEQRDAFERKLAAADAEREEIRGERDAARADAAEAHAALERAHADAEDRLASERSEFDQRLAGARAEADAALEAERERARTEVDGVRAESEAMLEAVREDAAQRSGSAETHARELAERLRATETDERRRADESSALREQLATAKIAREAAAAEADGLRSELERLGSELAVAREQAGPPGGDLSEARALLADARALTRRLREEPTG